MKTVTFFSYKGGTGRSLAVANASRYLARLGFKVAVMDFDLEAPGLHYKFKDSKELPLKVEGGVVDFLHEMMHGTSASPPNLAQYFHAIPVEKDVTGSITLIPAGHAPSPSYWPKLAALNWHQLFYSETGVGVKLFMELKQRIEDELTPDFLLIDSRTGVTETAGVATSLLPDALIALVLRSRENLDGSRAVLRSLAMTRRSFKLPALTLTVALSRHAKSNSDDQEKDILESVRAFLNEPAEDLTETLAIDSVEVLHTDAELQENETLRVGGDVSPNESVLYRDYLRLFRCLVSAEEMAPRMGTITSQLRNRMLENPDAVERDFEVLALSYGHPQAYLELLQYYRLRKDTSTKCLRSAQVYWEINGWDSSDSLLWYFVNGSYLRRSAEERERDKWNPDLGFFESVWRRAGRRDSEFALLLASELERKKRIGDAIRILIEGVAEAAPSLPLILQAIRLCNRGGSKNQAIMILERFKDSFGMKPEFLSTWAELALENKLATQVEALVDPVRLESLRLVDLHLVARLLKAAGRSDEARDAALAILSKCEHYWDYNKVFDLFREIGEQKLFLEMAKQRLPDGEWRDLSAHIEYKLR